MSRERNIYKRGGVLYGRISVRGHEIRKSLRTDDWAEARRRRKKLIEDAQKIRFDGEARHSWKAAFGRWMEEQAPHLKPATATRYQVSLKGAAPWLEHRHIDEIDRKMIAGFVSGRKKQKAGNATIRRDLTAISSVLGACVGWGWLEANPAKSYERSMLRERREPITMPLEADIDVVVSRCPQGMGKMVRWAQETGMRQEESGGLEHPQVDPFRKVAMLTKTKTSRPRAVPLDERALRTYVGTPRHITGKYVFWHDKGQRYLNIASRFRAIVAKALEDGAISRAFRFHDLRHWFAVDYLRRGGNIYALQQVLGHSSIRTTEIYLAYLTPDEAEQAKYGVGTKSGTV